jgi:GTP pyrophosphokinase
MMRQYELVDRVRRYNPDTDEILLNRAYVYAMKAHGAQVRASGDPYFSHPLEVAGILTDMRLDDATIVAAVLHDVIEDTEATRDEVDRLFGEEIGDLVEGLTKLKRLDLVSKRAVQAENFRKLLLAVAADVRVLLVKLADRLHNMRTLHFVAPEKRARIAEETLDIYAPLAGRMGMQRMRDELEDLAFRHLMPDAYATIEARLNDIGRKNNLRIVAIENEIDALLKAAGIHAEVKGRQKQPYSIWRKMERKSIAFEQMSDIFGFRILVDTSADCYRALGTLHTKWPMVPGRFKDYISTPKPNDYRSIHTTVVGPGRQRVELQIRSFDMHEVASNGIAAHVLYKEGVVEDSGALKTDMKAFQWLRRTIESLAEGSSPEEFLEHTKLELFLEQVFCFTPNGRLIALPRGATAIDFAYAVHTDVGNSAAGAKINGHAAPLLTELQNGDEVEIIRQEGQVPPSIWETLVLTGKARAAIRRATREAMRAQYANLGRQIVTRAFERAGRPLVEEKLKGALSRLGRSNVEDVLAAVGRGEMFSGDVLKAVHPDSADDRKPVIIRTASETGWFMTRTNHHVAFHVPGASEEVDWKIMARDGIHPDLAVRYAPNGGAVPGDRIVGILKPDESITVYPIQSSELTAFDDQADRWLDARWQLADGERVFFPAKLQITAINEPGTLGTIATVIGENGANIDNIVMQPVASDFRLLIADLEVTDVKHLSTIVSQLRARTIVAKVERVNGS